MTQHQSAWLCRALPVVLGVVSLLVITGAALAQTGVQFDGTNDYVTFGQAPSLGASTFTLELWFRRDGAGATTSTGTGGVTAVPLLTKGRGEADGDNRDMNYFLGIRATDNVLVADYEEGAGQTSPGLNHPVAGVTPIGYGTWNHVAVTFDGVKWQLFLNGDLETELTIGASHLPRFDSIQHAGLATAMTSTGAAAGYFLGVIDEARVWNRARGQQAIIDSMLIEVTSGTGLLGRWGLNEGSGTVANNSVAGGVNGTLTNGPLWVTGSPFEIPDALALGASNAYVTFGNAAALGLPQFTLETWFRRDGTGTAVSTGTGGVTAVPLITKGTGEVDAGDNRDMNYFFGIRSSDNVLAADFEEGAGGSSPSLNHPIVGVTPLVNGVWYHAAATYDGTKWQLFLNGRLENELTVGQPPRFDSIQHSGLGTSLKSDGTAAGYFNGRLDEVRIWNYARNATEINSTINSQIASSQTGLVARWALDEASRNAVNGSAGTTVNGTITGTGWSWAAGAPFDIAPPAPPEAPSDLTAAPISTTHIQLEWTDNANNELNFEVERSTDGPGGPFTLRVTLGPDVIAYADSGLTEGYEYCYRVRATNLDGDSDYSNVACATPVEVNHALDFGGSDGYATFGTAAALGLAEFTLEAWVRRDGAGATTTTGTGGVTAVPLITKGRGEVDEGDNRDMNYFFGLRGSDFVLAADFEEGAAGSSPSLNHPIVGVTPLEAGVWYHAAVTYDGSKWQLFLNGMLENELTVGQPPRFDSIQHAALASALTSTGTPQGYFDGRLDEVRVWDYARPREEIQATINDEIETAQAGLVARWSLNEGIGTAVHGSAGTAVDGSILGANWSWSDGAPFDIVIDNPPDEPVLVSPPDAAVDVPTSPELCVTVADPEADTLTVTFYGRPVTTSSGADFTLIGLPDTQFYTAEMNGGTNAIFKAQTAWVVTERTARNIAFVQQFGDLTQNGDTYEIEWQRADTSLAILEDSVTTGLSDGIPYGISIGNHDQTGGTVFYNQYFGEPRFAGRDYFGGQCGANNNNHFELFSVSGLDFIVINMEYDTSPEADVLDWADSLLAAHSGRRGVVASHNIIGVGNPASFTTQGQAIYDSLKDNPNLILMLCGHSTEEGRRSDTYNGRTVHTLMADYQSRTNGGDGWLRIMEFSPVNGVLRVKTYSPTLDQYEADADSSSQFTLPCDLAPGEEWQVIAVEAEVVSGSEVCVPWPGRSPLSEYEWYVAVSDGNNTVTGPIWSFTTIATAPLTIHIDGQGSVLRDPDQAAYDLGSTVILTAAPAEDWEFTEWSGDAEGSDNPLTVIMDAPKEITAHFREATAPQVTVVYPNGGEVLTIGFEASLQWTATDNVGVTAVDLLLSRTGEAGPYEPLATGIENSGSHPWMVTGPPTTQAVLKVVAHDAAGNSGEDLSDAVFTILTSGSGVEEEVLPTEFALANQSANPIRGMARFRFAVPRAAQIRVSVLDVQGREVAVLAEGHYRPGYYQALWHDRMQGGYPTTGVYFIRMTAPGKTIMKRVLLMR